jgi:T5SS/PEP-CTERM-associated repeat protein
MAQFNWIGGSGDLGDPNNWTDQPDPNNPVVPGPGDDVFISGDGTLTGTDTVSYAGLNGNIDLEGTLSAADGHQVVDVYGEVVVQNGGVLSAAGHITVGYSGTGALTVENGAATSPYMNVGGLAGGDGNVTVGAGGSLTLTVFGIDVGFGGTGALAVENQGVVTTTGVGVGILAGSIGSVTISTGASLTVNGDLGVDAGTLDVNTGATVRGQSIGIGDRWHPDGHEREHA